MRHRGQYPRLVELEAQLRTLDEGSPALAGVPSALREAFGADRSLAYSLQERGDKLQVDALHGAGFPRLGALRQDFDTFLEGAPTDWASFNPVRPEPRQRNVPMDVHDIERVTGESAFKPVTQSMYPRHGMRMEEQLRLLVCQGPSLLCWVGVYRPEPFSAEEKHALRDLAPALRFRLALERRLDLVQLQAQIIDKALEAVPGAAFLLSGAGAVAHANARGRALLEHQDRGLKESLSDAAQAEAGLAPHDFEVTRLRAAGMADHFLVIDRSPQATSPVLAAAARWSLTARQHEVLGHLAQGQANKTIAAELGCAESTVEIHVTAILAKAGAESRAELIARVYTGR